mmetsp:Transcript_62219/g.129109  ORF Transcript_62219/g.129109 Transcript_62219/m.129109 type:complete len:210 (+) Transcript_62219:262-891(+)
MVAASLSRSMRTAEPWSNSATSSAVSTCMSGGMASLICSSFLSSATVVKGCKSKSKRLSPYLLSFLCPATSSQTAVSKDADITTGSSKPCSAGFMTNLGGQFSRPNPDHCAKHSPSFVASRSSCGGRKMRGDSQARPSFKRRSFRLRTVSRPRNPSKMTCFANSVDSSMVKSDVDPKILTEKAGRNSFCLATSTAASSTNLFSGSGFAW